MEVSANLLNYSDEAVHWRGLVNQLKDASFMPSREIRIQEWISDRLTMAGGNRNEDPCVC